MRLGTLVKPVAATPWQREHASTYGIVTSWSPRRGTMSVLPLERNRRDPQRPPLLTARAYGPKEWVPVDEPELPDTLEGICDYTKDEWIDLGLRYPDCISAFLNRFMNPPQHSPKGYRL